MDSAGGGLATVNAMMLLDEARRCRPDHFVGISRQSCYVETSPTTCIARQYFRSYQAMRCIRRSFDRFRLTTTARRTRTAHSR